jgi:dipeptidyl-peptidase-3
MSTAAGKTSGDEPTPAHLAAYGLSAGELSRFVAPREQPVCQLDARKAFALLTAREQQYALHFSRASWAGALACLATASPESPGILCLLQGLFAGAEAREGIPRSPEGGHELMQYAAAFYGNFSNYASFGDTKIVPRLPAAQFRALVAAHDRADGSLTALFDKLADRIYALGEGDRAIGFAPEGTTGYYGAGITREEAQAVQDVLTANSVNVLNTRLARDTAESAGPGHYVLLVASAEDGDDGGVAGREFASADGSVRIRTRRGDFARSMQIVADEIAQAGEFAAGEHQANFCKSYVEHFRSGAHEPYIKSQMDWVRDVGPAVETNIGYVETYTDPLGVRAEFEGFVACVNKDTSAKFNALVAAAEPLIAKLPWPKFMEKEAFLKPDFTSLEVVTFGSRGIPAGINIPNLECVRATHGFKNVSLQNVLSARVPDDKATFLRDEDQALFKELQGPAFAVQVGVHELLGHGSGRLLMESAPGKLNFDPAACTDPLTNKPVANWYKPGESWESKFTNLANPYEESRAEAVGVFLAGDPTVLEIFGHKGERAGDVVVTAKFFFFVVAFFLSVCISLFAFRFWWLFLFALH